MTIIKIEPVKSNICVQPYAGLSKREYFAAMTFQAMVSSTTNNGKDTSKDMAQTAVKYATALLHALEEP